MVDDCTFLVHGTFSQEIYVLSRRTNPEAGVHHSRRHDQKNKRIKICECYRLVIVNLFATQMQTLLERTSSQNVSGSHFVHFNFKISRRGNFEKACPGNPSIKKTCGRRHPQQMLTYLHLAAKLKKWTKQNSFHCDLSVSFKLYRA